MAPPGSGKRKRPDRQYSHEDGSGRPSPHRPESLPMAQQGNHASPRAGGRGRGPRRPSSQVQNAGQQTSSAPPASTATASASTAALALPNDQASSAPTPIVEPQIPLDPRRSVLPPALPIDDEPDGPPSPFDYEYITEDVVEKWDETGRASLVDAEYDAVGVATLVQELVRSGLDARLKPEAAGALIADLISKDAEVAGGSSLGVETQFLDAISLLDEKDQRRRALYDIVAATGIDPDVIRHELDVALLQSLQLVRSTFNQMRTRKTTNVLYRQANYNLLREESEGYAKLITDFYNASNDATTEGADPQMGKDAFHRITALVGAFDLDVGRVLDVIMDISANTLVKAYRFYLKLYRYSSWWPDNAVLNNIQWTQEDLGGIPGWALPDSGKWQYDDQDKTNLQAQRQARDERFWPRAADIGMDAFSQLGARRIVDFESVLPLLEVVIEPELDAKGREVNADRRNRINETRKYMRETKMLPPSGNSDAAQLLGFKLRFYASSARDKSDVLPENIIYLAALLIKVGFISLKDLYPHLYPADADMEQERERLEKEKEDKLRKDRPGGGINALSSAAALTDDSIPAVRSLRTENAKSGGSSPKVDKKDEAPVDDLPPPANQKLILLKALLAIGAIPEALFIIGKFPWLVEVDVSLPTYLLRLVKQMLSKLTLSVRPQLDDSSAQTPKPQLADTVAAADGTLRFASRPGVKLRKWLGLEGVDSGDGFVERHYYTDWDENVPVCQTIEDFFVLCNTFINLVGVKVGQDVTIITTMVRLARRSLSEDTSEHNERRWLDLIRRLILPALSLAKHNPGLTEEMYNVLSTFSITTRFSLYEEWYTGKTSRNPDVKAAFNKNRAEVKDVLRRITNESGKKMARALGKVTYSSPGIVVMTFINQLESYSNMIPGLVESVRYFTPFAFDILIWVLIRSLSGQGRDRMQADGMLTSAWLQALSQFTASLFTRYSTVNPSPVLQYVAFELRNGDSTDLELIDQVVAEMAGVRSDMNFNDIQVLGMTGGEALQSVIVQQLADVRHLRKTSAKRLVKSLSDPGITAQILISIAQERQMYAHRDSSKTMPLKVLGNNLDKIQQVFAQYLEMLKANMTPAELHTHVPDVISLIKDFGIEPGVAFTISRIFLARLMAQSDAIRRKPAKQNGASQDEETPADGFTEAEEREYFSTYRTAPDSKDASTWYPFLDDIALRLSDATGARQRVNALFFTAFWTFSAEQLNAPLDIYTSEINKAKQEEKQISNDRTNTSSAAQKEKERKLATLNDLHKRLHAELPSRVSVFGDSKKWFTSRKKDWFPPDSEQDEVDARHLHLLQDCFLPRALLSAMDAEYCFLVLKTLHSVSTFGFSVLRLLNQLMRPALLSSIILQSTAREAEHLGRFLLEVFKWLEKWHADKAVYEKEALGSRRNLLGFATTVDAEGTALEQLDYEGFRRTLFEWHNAVKDALKTCFESGDYMQIRNGIVLLKSICAVYPALKFHGTILQGLLKTIAASDPRDDLKLAALSLQGPLKSREKKWIIVQDFKMSGGGEDEEMADIIETEQGPAKLNAEAPEFKPGSSVGDGRVGAEDGEIEDDKDNTTSDKNGDVDNASSNKVEATAEPSAAEPDSQGKPEQTTTPAGDETAKKPTAQPETTAAAKPIAPPDKRLPESGRATPNSRSAQTPDRKPGRADERYGRLDRPSEVRQSTPRDAQRPPEGRERPARPIERSPNRPPSFRDSDAIRSNGRAGDRRQADASQRQDQIARDRATPVNAAQHPDRAAQTRNDSQRSASGPGPRPSTTASEMSSVVSQPSINPARAALINQDGGRPHDSRYDRPESRANGRVHAGDGVNRDGEATPTGPKAPRGAGGRDLFEHGGGRHGGPDHGGRLSRDSTHNQAHSGESSYGRLNGDRDVPPTTRPPNGPSIANRVTRGPDNGTPSLMSRTSTPTQQSSATRPGDQPSTRDTPNKESPRTTRPTRSRHGEPERPGSSLRADQQPTSTSLPATPVNESGPAIHPSRLANLGVDTSHANPRGAGSPPHVVPSGPRGHNRPPPGTPTGPSPTSNVPPSGPGSGNERQKRNDRGRANTAANTNNNSTSLVNSSQGVSFRGAALHNNSASNGSNTAASDGPRALVSSMEAPTARPDTDRMDRSRAEMIQRASGKDNGNRAADGPRTSRNSSRDRRYGDHRHAEGYGGNEMAAAARHDRGPRDVHHHPDGGMRGGRDNDGPPARRPAPPSAPGSFAGPPSAQDWNARGPPRGGYGDREDGRGGDDYRNGRGGGADNNAGRRAGPGPASEVEGRKRRHEDGPPSTFDNGAKRRRSNR